MMVEVDDLRGVSVGDFVRSEFQIGCVMGILVSETACVMLDVIMDNGDRRCLLFDSVQPAYG